MSNPSIQFTRFAKTNGKPMTKHLTLDAEGNLKKDSSLCRMAEGTALRREIAAPHDLIAELQGLKPNEAIGIGVCEKPVADIVVDAKVEGDKISRTKKYYDYPNNGAHALVPYDHDPDDRCPYTIKDPSDFLMHMRELDPQYKDVGYVRTYSTSSGIYLENDEVLRPPQGFHLYCAGDGQHMQDYTTALYHRAFEEDKGFIKISRSGQRLERTLFDKAVFSPERLLFEAGAALGPGLKQVLPPPEYREGPRLNMSALKPSHALRRRYESKVRKLRAAAAEDAARVRAVYNETEGQKLQGQHGNIDLSAARRLVAARLQGALYSDEVLYFAHEPEPVLVADVLAHPDEYLDKYLADPEEGLREGRSRARLGRKHGHLVVFSWMRGGKEYELIAGRPRGTVMLEGTRIDDQIKELDDALAAPGVEIFQRGDFIVEPGTAGAQDAKADLQRDPAAQRLFEMNTHRLVVRATSAARFLGREGKKGPVKSVDCPDRLAAKYLAMNGHRELSELKALLTVPFLRPDGTVVATDGYDHENGILMRLQGLDKVIGAMPTLQTVSSADVQWAKAQIDPMFAEFPFVSDADRAVPLSQMFSIMQRPFLPTVPLHGYNAYAPGTGKSLCLDTAAVGVLGTRPAAMAYIANMEENEKRISAALIEGDHVVKLDNIEVPLQGELLAQAATEQYMKIRRLGVMERVPIISHAVFTATGNNLRVRGDVGRRSVISSMNAHMQRPELRDGFRIKDLPGYARAHRPQIVKALLLLQLAYIAEGEPASGKAPVGSFEVWTRKVRDLLVFHGYADPFDTQEYVRGSNEEERETQLVFNALFHLYGWDKFTAAEVFTVIDRVISGSTAPDKEKEAVAMVREAIGEEKSRSVKAVSAWMRAHADTHCGDLILRLKPARVFAFRFDSLLIQ